RLSATPKRSRCQKFFAGLKWASRVSWLSRIWTEVKVPRHSKKHCSTCFALTTRFGLAMLERPAIRGISPNSNQRVSGCANYLSKEGTSLFVPEFFGAAIGTGQTTKYFIATSLSTKL